MTGAHGVNRGRVLQIDEPAGAIAPRIGSVTLHAAESKLIGGAIRLGIRAAEALARKKNGYFGSKGTAAFRNVMPMVASPLIAPIGTFGTPMLIIDTWRDCAFS
jgi:hypothetical protein